MKTFNDLERSVEPQLKPHFDSSGSITEDLVQRQIDKARVFHPFYRRREDIKLDFYQLNPWLAFAVHLFGAMNLLYLGFLEGPSADGGELHWQWCFWKSSNAARQLWG